MTAKTCNRTGNKNTLDVLVGGHVFTTDLDSFARRSTVLMKAIKEANAQQPDPRTLVVVKSKDAYLYDVRNFSMYEKSVEAGDVDMLDTQHTIPFPIDNHALAWQLKD